MGPSQLTGPHCPPIRLLLRRCLQAALALIASSAMAANFGTNPTVTTGSFDPLLDLFSGTLTISSGGSISMSANASIAQAYVLTGNNTFLTYSITPRTLTLTSTGSLTRSGAGT